VHIRGLEPLVRMIWLVALIPVLKGLGQIIYAAFFADSIANLTEKFLPLKTLERVETSTNLGAVTDPQLSNPPSSVTERTTQFFDDAPPHAGRESQ
jgi:hypothetical protein